MLHFNAPCDVILLAGQSNAEGCGRGEVDRPYEPTPRILEIRGVKHPHYQNIDGVDQLVDVENEFQVGVADLKWGGCGCLALYFAREYVNAGLLKEGRKLLIVYAPVGGTGFARGQWNMEGNLYKRMIEMTNDALGLHKDNKLVALLWHQGESDSFPFASDGDEKFKKMEDRYYNYLSAFVSSVRERYEAPELPFIAAKFVNDEWYKANKAGADAVYAATERVVKACGNAAFLETADLSSNDKATGNGDTIHFCHESLRILGERYFEAFTKIVK